MLPTLLGVLAAVPVLGEAGESCRNDADCVPSLACLAATCTQRAPERVAEPPPLPVRSTSTAEVSDAIVVDEPQPQFSGVHFFLRVAAGMGPAWLNTGEWAGFRWVSFSSASGLIPIEVHAGILVGRFEVAAEVSPGLTLFFYSNGRPHGSAALSLGGLIKLYETENFSISLPIRARGGGFLAGTQVGGLLGASVGVALRFGGALLEARLLTGEVRRVGSALVTSLPFSLTASWIF